MNAMVNEWQQTVDLTQQTGFHWNHRISPFPGTDIKDLNEQMVFYLFSKKEKKKLLEFGSAGISMLTCCLQKCVFFTEYLNYLNYFVMFLLTSYVWNLSLG